MRRILVGVMVAMVAVAGPALAGPCCMNGGCPNSAASQVETVHLANPSGRVIDDRTHGAGAEFGLALASTGMSLLYFPVRMVYGVLGAHLGGFGGWTTGGDLRTAKGLWRPTTEGHYFMRPDYLDGTERFRFNGAVPPVRESELVEERVVTSRESVVAERPLELESADDDDDAL